ncbi:helix-turn-helix domain-containing protein [Streptomyces sp. WZ-12]|uniref:helix-turn-helix domain-containing protein n=1 Tax=Streptomyces sp. WZ-12 TaxID=3030210 RepID=UPI0023815310|nr:helix-turn-helix transcriptional regulator [Streptomyces sp. WZ-12]
MPLTPRSAPTVACFWPTGLDRLVATRSLSLRDVSGLAGVAHSTVARVLTGEVLPDIGTLTRLDDRFQGIGCAHKGREPNVSV